MQDRGHDKLFDKISWKSSLLLAIFVLATVVLVASPASADERRSEADVNRPQPESESESAQTGADASSDRMSRQFSAAALHALSTLRWTRMHLAYTLNNGYPLSNYWVTRDRELAADALNLATIAASTEGDQAALRELLQYDAALQHWIDDMLVAYHEMRLAEYYMSPAALQNDSQYQALLTGEGSLTALLGSDRVLLQPEPEERSARSDVEKGQ